MIRFFADHPTAANVLMILLLLLGMVAVPGMQRETFPNIERYEVSVSVAYPGASAEDVEESICKLLEDATDGISFLEERTCDAQSSAASMTLKMQEVGDFDDFISDINRAVDGITGFPQDVESPVVTELNTTDHVVSVAITAEVSQVELKALAEAYRESMLRTPGIPIVDIYGFSNPQLRVEVDDFNLSKYGLSLKDIANRISVQAESLPLGTLETENGIKQIKFDTLAKTPETLRNLVIISQANGGEVRLGDIAKVYQTFETREDKILFNGQRAAILRVSKNKTDDSLDVLGAVNTFLEQAKASASTGVQLALTEDSTSIVQDRLQLLSTNGWQGILLVVAVLFLFFNARYTLWVAMGLPVSFLASMMVISALGVSINMISMVALLIAIGIIMDDAIVISESIATEYAKGLSPLDAAVKGVQKVARGIFSSFVTTLLIFGGLLFLKGDMGQVLKVLPMVLISILTISLIEAFLILPHHLKVSLEHHHDNETPRWRLKVEERFARWRTKLGQIVETAIQFRYACVGIVLGLFILSISLIPAGIVKFKGFPDVDGDILQGLILLPQGTPLETTEAVVKQVTDGLEKANEELMEIQGESLVKNVRVDYNTNSEAGESGTHVATVKVDLLSAEEREVVLDDITAKWRAAVGDIPGVITLQYKEPSMGPAGRAIKLRLQGGQLSELKAASNELQAWLMKYPGTVNISDDLRPGKPEYRIKVLEGVLGMGLTNQEIAQQLRTAYQGSTLDEIQSEGETFDLYVTLSDESRDTLTDFDRMMIIHPETHQPIPLVAIASIEEVRPYAKIQRVNGLRTVTIVGDVEGGANSSEIIQDTLKRFIPKLQKEYPDISLSIEGESKNNKTTGNSFGKAFLVGIVGIFLLLSLQFKNYVEPWIVLLAIPMALIGVIWGHLLMGLDLTMPSIMGFVSLAGIVVNNSILLVEFVKMRVSEGLSFHDAASKATQDRFRAIFLTTLTTMMGMLPLLFETSFQAQILIPLVASIVFGLMSSTVLILIVLPALYSILEDLNLAKSN